MSREIMQQALTVLKAWDALIKYQYCGSSEAMTAMQNVAWRTLDTIEGLEQELAKPEQEPVAWRNAAIRLGEDLYSVGPNGYYDMTAKQWLDWALSVVNTAPPRKPWVGLTSEDWENLPNTGKQGCERDAEIFDWIEAKLKQKNT